MQHSLDNLLDAAFVFRRRHAPLAPDLRPIWRVYVLLLLIDGCRGQRANLEQLHVLDWAIRTPATRLALLRYILGEDSHESALVRFDPSLDRAVSLAVGAGLLAVVGRKEDQTSFPDYRVTLTPEGQSAVKQIYEVPDLFVEEKQLISALPHKLTQTDVRSLFDWGDS